MQMHLTSLKSAPPFPPPGGREESYGAVGHIAHNEAVAGVCVQEGKGKRVGRINEESCHISAGNNEGKYVCVVSESFTSRNHWLIVFGVV